MFMVIKKDKIIAYIVSLSTVAILFVMSTMITSDKNEIMHTSTNLITNKKNISNIIEKNEYNFNNET